VPKAGDRFGDFVLEHELGRGAMGVVWAARQDALDRDVALKILGEGYAADPVWVERFRTEAGAAARLSHPGILPVYAVGEAQGLPWFAMEKVEGQDLAKQLEAGGRLPWNETAAVVRDAALALHHAHEHGLVHRDIKPANLMRRTDGRVVLTDFGLCKRLGSGSLTVTGLLVGTPYYMSPELVAGGAGGVGPSTDIYGLGVTLYELLTGVPPFTADNPIALIKKIVEDDPLPPTRRDARIPRDLETIALTCLAKRPEKRYATAKELAEDLDRYLRGEPITRRRPGAGERIGRFVSRHRTVVAISGTAVLLLGGMVWYFNREIDSRDAQYREQIARILAEADELADAGDLERADALEQKLEAIAAQGPEAARATVAAMQRNFLEDVKAGRDPGARYREDIQGWSLQAPAKITLVADAPGASARGLRLLTGEAPEEVDLPLDGRDLTAGLWRLSIRAPGRVPTTVTLMASPGLVARLPVTLPREDAATAGMRAFGGAWFPVNGGKVGDATSVEQVVPPYLLDVHRVTVREYRAFVMAQDPARRENLKPAPRGERAPPGEDEPIQGITAVQARAYATWKGKRLPTAAELRNAIGPGRVQAILRGMHGVDRRKGKDWFARAREVGKKVGEAVERTEGIAGWDGRPEWAVLGAGEKGTEDGVWPSLRAELAAEEGTSAEDPGLPEWERRPGGDGVKRYPTLRLARTLAAP
jgi:hypothetical protein